MSYAVQYPEHLSALILLNTMPANNAGQKALMFRFLQKTNAIRIDIAPLFSYE